MKSLRSSAILAATALAIFGGALSAQAKSGKIFARYNRPIESATLDLATGTLTHGPAIANRAVTTIADFQNIDLSGFSGIDTGGGFCEWFDAGVKGFAGNASDLMDSIVFSYCSAKLTPGSGGPGGSVKLGFWEGYTAGGGPSTSVASFTLTGLPGNSASSSFFGGFKCLFLRIRLASLVCFADGNIGYSWKFLDNGTGTINPLGGTLAGTWPFMACVASCSGSLGQVDGQGMTDTIDKYCPPGTLRTTFSFGTDSGSYTSMSMQIEEVTTKVATVAKFNSAIAPNPDELCAEAAKVGRPWTASITLGLDRTPNNWVMFFGNATNDVLIPQGSAGLNFGTNKAGRMLLSPRMVGITMISPHTGVAGSTSTSAAMMIPKEAALICNPWCGQAVVVGAVSAGNGGGGVRLSSAVSGVVGTNDPPPVAAFAGAPRMGLAPLTVNFVDLSTGDITAWSWDFGDGGTSTLETPSHTYSTGGTFAVSLTVSGPDGSNTRIRSPFVVVTEPLMADFSGTPVIGSAPLAVSFSDLSVGTAVAWSWDFGDAGTSALQNPVHTYTAVGTYTVSLTATGPTGSDVETKVDYIVVGEPAPLADFSATPLSGTAPLSVGFSDLSTGAVTSWSWDFGDTFTSTLQNPGHSYTAAGTYSVTLTATGPGGPDVETKSGYIVVSDAAPVADFSGTPLSGTSPLSVSFTDLSVGNVTSWSWDFGDTGTSALQNPANSYTVAGTYTVTLTTTGPGGSDNETKFNYVLVGDPAPVADFSATPLSGVAPLAVTFTDLSSGPVNSWSWDFGDTGTSALQNPGHTYTSVAAYTVTLTTTGPGGSDGETKVAYVVVGEPAPVADFSASPLSGTAPLAVSFTDLSTGSVTTWNWDFGDSASSSLQNPGHSYAAAGTYTVTLTATGPGGSDAETKVAYVVVGEPPPVADFSATPLSGITPLDVTFADLSTGPVTSWSWDFGDTGTSTLQAPTHSYTVSGNFTVTLTATGPGGSDGETKVAYIVVTKPPPVADFIGTPQAGTAPLTVTFADLTTGPVTSWNWDFGDSATSTLQNPTHVYAAAGNYSVTLTSTGAGGSDGEVKFDYVIVN